MFRFACCSVLLAAAFAPASAVAQMVVAEPPMMAAEAPPMLAPGAPMNEDMAAQIAMMNGIVVVEDVDRRVWDGNYEVEGSDATGNDLEITIDGMTGAVLKIDD